VRLLQFARPYAAFSFCACGAQPVLRLSKSSERTEFEISSGTYLKIGEILSSLVIPAKAGIQRLFS
jgi:hypothetical protein